MDNARFNITGKGQKELEEVLELVFRREFDWPKVHPKQNEGYGFFTGYRLHTHLGFLLHRYAIDHNDTVTQKFPFEEGKSPRALGGFIMNYLGSAAAKVIDPKVPTEGLAYDEYEKYRADFNWDKDMDHDGHNSSGWRVYTGPWGQVDGNYRIPYAIRPIFAWHGK